MDDVRSTVRRVVAFGLSASERPLEPVVVSEDAWGPLLAELVHQRLTGLAVAAAEGGVLALREKHEAELLGRHRSSMMLALTLEDRLRALASALEDRGIDYAALKGPAIAHTSYPDPSWRAFGDLDVLVPPRHLAGACDLLSDMGFRRVYPEPRPRFVERFGSTALHRDRDGIEVDLHRTLVSGPFGQWIDTEELLDGVTTFRLGDKDIKRLGDTALFLHACIHASLGHRPPLLMPTRDVGQILQTASIDEARLASWAGRWHLRGVVRHAVGCARETTGTGPSPGVQALCDRRPTGRERWALEAYSTTRRERGGRAFATLRAIPGIRRKQAFVRAMLLPDPRFLEWRVGRGRYSLLRRWTVPLSWLRPTRDRPRV